MANIVTVILSIILIGLVFWLTSEKNGLDASKHPKLYKSRNLLASALIVFGSIIIYLVAGVILKSQGKELDDIIVLIHGVIVILPVALRWTLGGVVGMAFEYFSDINSIPRYVKDKSTKFVIKDESGVTHSGYFEFLRIDDQVAFKLLDTNEPWRFIYGRLESKSGTTEQAIIILREINGRKQDGITIPATLPIDYPSYANE